MKKLAATDAALVMCEVSIPSSDSISPEVARGICQHRRTKNERLEEGMKKNSSRRKTKMRREGKSQNGFRERGNHRILPALQWDKFI